MESFEGARKWVVKVYKLLYGRFYIELTKNIAMIIYDNNPVIFKLELFF